MYERITKFCSGHCRAGVKGKSARVGLRYWVLAHRLQLFKPSLECDLFCQVCPTMNALSWLISHLFVFVVYVAERTRPDPARLNGLNR